MFRIENATVVFDTEAAVRDASLEIQPGERVGIVGPSGAGKTTLLRLLIGAVRPTEGRILFDGEDLATLGSKELRALRAGTGFVHQDHRLVPNQRVLTNVLTGRLGRWSFLRSLREVYLPRRTDVERVHALLDAAGIPEKLYQRVDSLSGGQQQRVAVARALYQDPRVLLADEPVSSVDPARARDTVALLTRVAEEQGIALCVSIHDLVLAREFFPRLVGMRAGEIVFDCATDELTDADFEELYRLSADEMMKDA